MNRSLTTLLMLAFFLPTALMAGEKKSKEEQELEWKEKVREICVKVEELRGLEFRKKVGVGMKSEQELLEFLNQALDEEMPAEKFAAIQLAYSRMGLIPADMDLKKTFIDLMTSQVGGFYNPKNGKLFVIDRKSGEGKKKDPMTAMMEAGLKMFGITMDEIVAAHELTHALQDQHFGLEKLDKAAAGNDDRILALKCVIEGDATVMMMEYLYDKVPFARQRGGMAGGAMGGPMGPGLDKVPEILKAPLTYPYIGGALLVEEARKRGGWSAVNEMFSNPPLSTEQVLHIEKYFTERDDPTDIDFKDVASLPGEGCTLLETNVFGEFGMRIYLGEGLGRKESNAAAAGWDGDRFAAYKKGDRAFYFVYTTWDSEAEATEFAGASKERILKLAGGKAGAQEASAGPGRSYWAATIGDSRAIVEARGADVVIIEGLDREETQLLRDRLFSTVRKSQAGQAATAPAATQAGRIEARGFSITPPEGWAATRGAKFDRVVVTSQDGAARIEVGMLSSGDANAASLLDDLKRELPGRLARYQLVSEKPAGKAGASIEFEGEDPLTGRLCRWEMTIRVRKGEAVITTFVAPKREREKYSAAAEKALGTLEIE